MSDDMDKGPWEAFRSQVHGEWVVWSDDFTHDVTLVVKGDFADGATRRAYCEWLARKLNGEGSK